MTYQEQIGSLLDRVADLEADRCACSHCVQRRRERDRLAVVARLAAIKSLPRDERNQAIASLPELERVTFLREHASPEVFAEALEQWLTYAPPYVRDLVEIERVEIPRHAFLSLAPIKPGEWGTTEWTRQAIEVDADTAITLGDAGLGDRVRKRQRGAYVYQPIDFLAGHRHLIPRKALDTMLFVDPEFADAVKAGKVVVTERTLDEDRALLLDRWRRMPVHERTTLRTRGAET